MKLLRMAGALLLLSCLSALGGVGVGAQAAEAAKETRDLLALHVTVCRFEGIEQQVCRGMTSLCPDHCGSSGRFAKFTVLTYLAYAKPGEYGDPKQTTFQIQIDDTQGKSKLPAELAGKIAALKAGDSVLLAWRHDYVHRDGASFPERPITMLDPITAKDARQLIPVKQETKAAQ